jgi:hypothetical protein
MPTHPTAMTLDILPDGTVRHLHSESPLALAIDSALGGPILAVNRASEVEFNMDTMQWEVHPVDRPHTVLFSHPSRAECLAWEDANILAHLNPA